ncbi:hypothetical protein FM109_13265 [Vibrio casei]|nr:hypothetical protein FM109_13265 [Vibrio casei]
MVLINPEEREDAIARYQQALVDDKTPAKVIAHTDLTGNPVLVEITDKPVIWQGQQALCTFISIVTDTIKKQQDLKQLSEQDPLTLIHNRRYIHNVLNDLRKNKNTESYLQAIIDIDYFKQINDQYGHLAGDKVLQQLTQILKHFTQPGDHLARLGGEEFILLIQSNSQDLVMARLEDIRSTIEKNNFTIICNDTGDNTPVHCTVSIGVSAINLDKNVDLSYGQSDKALYIAKQQGRNRIISLNSV